MESEKKLRANKMGWGFAATCLLLVAFIIIFGNHIITGYMIGMAQTIFISFLHALNDYRKEKIEKKPEPQQNAQ